MKKGGFLRGFIVGFIFAVTLMVVGLSITKPAVTETPKVSENQSEPQKVIGNQCCVIWKGICQLISDPLQCGTGQIVDCNSIICNPRIQ